MLDTYNLCLHQACSEGRSALIEHLLLIPGVDLNSVDAKGLSPMLKAIEHGHVEVVDALLKHGADTNIGKEAANIFARGYYVQSPLTCACKHGNIAIVKMLLLAGAEMEVSNTYTTDSALRTACCCGQLDVVKLLVEFGADLHEYDGPYTTLSTAAEGGHADLALYLIEQWVDHRYKYHDLAYDYDADPEDGNEPPVWDFGNAIVVAEGEGHWELARNMRLAILARIHRRQVARAFRVTCSLHARRRINLTRLDEGVDCMEAVQACC